MTISYKTEKVLEFYAKPPAGPDCQVPDFYDELCFGDKAKEALERVALSKKAVIGPFILLVIVAMLFSVLDGNFDSVAHFYGPFLLGAVCSLLYVRYVT